MPLSLPHSHETFPAARTTAVSASATHAFGKPNRLCIRLLAGLGVEDDAHLGVTVKHRSRVAKDPSQPNLRQVHLITEETLANLLTRIHRRQRTAPCQTPCATPCCPFASC